MKNYLGRVVLLVEDYDRSADFYEKNFCFQRLVDYTTEVGQRFLHIGPDGISQAGIWFLKADTEKQKGRIGNQTGEQPTLVIYTSDIQQLFAQLKTNGVQFKTDLVETPEYAFFHCYDLDGNELIVTELRK
jgi:predicted enzyme related to lactoylglutathione lyase